MDGKTRTGSDNQRERLLRATMNRMLWRAKTFILSCFTDQLESFETMDFISNKIYIGDSR